MIFNNNNKKKTHTGYFSEKSKRTDSGKYELALRNAKGEVKIPIEVIVLGKKRKLFDFF